jgi:hypothetical protein
VFHHLAPAETVDPPCSPSPSGVGGPRADIVVDPVVELVERGAAVTLERDGWTLTAHART